MNKQRLLSELGNKTFLILKPSKINGIGVFAIKDIPKGCRKMFSRPQKNWIKVSKYEANELPVNVRRVIKNYCVFDTKNYYVPNYGFKVLDIINFLNHSKEPNVRTIDGGNYYEAIRKIKTGEELLLNYDELF